MSPDKVTLTSTSSHGFNLAPSGVIVSDNINQDIAISGEGNIVVGKGDVIINPLPPAEARLRRDLGILLKNVQTTWIKGVLEKSVYEAALLELGMELREEAVDNPWRMVLEGPDQSRETIARGSKINDIFDEANRLLLILGEPGSGKTTTLLQLARDLIGNVDQAFTQPVPVILNLSTWTNKQQTLDDWLVAELNSKYLVPKQDGQTWLRERRILPLLDGLDEVKAENRAACVERINRLVMDYGLQGLVVCSRVKDYTNLNVRLAFYRAIYLQPLTPEQADEYLDQAGDKLASLRTTLQIDEALRSMAQSPLILNVMSLAYQDTSAETLSNPALETDEARRRHLFNTYIARMLNRKASGRTYDNQQTKYYLSWLARNMQRHNQDVFLIESLQPSWLSTRRWQWLYVVISRLISLLTFGLRAGLGGAYVWQFITSGVIAGLTVGLIDALRFEWLRKRKWMIKSPAGWWSAINIGIVGISSGPSFGMHNLWEYGPIFGLIFGLRGSRQNLENDIQTVEAVHWSWRGASLGGLIGGIGGLIIALAGWSGFPYQRGEHLYRLSGLSFGVIVGLMGIILFGLRREIIETKSRPNEGIRLSIRNAIFGGLLIGLLSLLGWGLVYGLMVLQDFGLSGGLRAGLRVGPIYGKTFALIGALWYGGLDIIQHYTLRLILLIQGHTPTNYARFLDYAVDRIFLQKVGGGYRFIHRLLLEHFAEMGETKKIA